MNTQKGIAPIVIISIIVLVSGGVFAVVQRNVLKSYFEKGDKPSETQAAKPGEQDRTELKDKFHRHPGSLDDRLAS